MSEKQWGECKSCEWWQIEPEAAIENETMGLCIDKDVKNMMFHKSKLDD